MLGSLARKLRIFGFDTLYFREGKDSELKALARRQGRTILTSDSDLFRSSIGGGLNAFLIVGRTDRARLLSLQKQTGMALARKGPGRASRCAVCNGELSVVSKSQISNEDVPPKVLERHRLFFQCRSCSRLYWRGSHWKRLRPLSRALGTKPLT